MRGRAGNRYTGTVLVATMLLAIGLGAAVAAPRLLGGNLHIDPIGVFEKLYLKTHADRFGRPRPDLWRAGMQAFHRLPISATWHSGRVPARALEPGRGAGGSRRHRLRARPSRGAHASAQARGSVRAHAVAGVRTATGPPASFRVWRSTTLRERALAPRITVRANAAGVVTGAGWVQIGPNPLTNPPGRTSLGNAGPDSGQVVDYAIDPRGNADSTMYLAAGEGGVWKTTDGGQSWLPIADGQASLSAGAVALDPSNPDTVYVGTGNSYATGGAFPRGIGIYKSTDGGATWTTVGAGIFTGVNITRIAVLPNGVLVVASDRGIYRSVDGGNHFGNNAPTFDNTLPIIAGCGTGASVDPGDSQTVYATIASATIYTCSGSGATAGVYVSTDGGATFNPVLTSANGGPSSFPGNVAFSQSTLPDDKTLYAIAQGAGACASSASPGNCIQLYKSTDHGATWAAEPGLASTSEGQLSYGFTIAVDPLNPAHVFTGFVHFFMSFDGGQSFSFVGNGQLHGDHHALVYSPPSHAANGATSSQVYVGTDGGIATHAPGSNAGDYGSNWQQINAGLATDLLRGFDIGRGSNANDAYSYGGAQDNGLDTRQPGLSGESWIAGSGGDGGPVAVDPKNAQHAVANLWGGGPGVIEATTNGGTSWSNLGVPNLPPFVVVAYDPKGQNVWAAGSGNNLLRSTDNGSTFTQVATFGATVASIAVAPQDSNRVWVGLSDGTMATSGDALVASPSFSPVTVATPNPGQISSIAIDPTDSNTVVVTCEGFSGGLRHAFETTNGGLSWSDISGTAGGSENLPDLPTHAVVIDPGSNPHSIIVADDAGVLRTLDGGATWQRLGVGLPAVAGTYLSLDSSVDPPVLRVGTFGRSAFELLPLTGPALQVNGALDFGTVQVGQSAQRTVHLYNVGSSDLHISDVSNTSGSSDFTLFSESNPSGTIPPGGHDDITVAFAPKSHGSESATFTVQSDDPSQPNYLIPASGTGSAGMISVSGDINFGVVPLGGSASASEVVTNVGDAPLVVQGVSANGDAGFSVDPTPATPLVLLPNQSAFFTIRYAPPPNAPPGLQGANINIQTDDPTNTDTVVKASAQVGVPQIALRGDLGFGPVARGSSASLQVIALNAGQAPLTLKSAKIAGNPAFSVSAPSTTPLAPGQSTALKVTFAPPAGSGSALRTATLHVYSDDPLKPDATVPATGQPGLPKIDVTGDLSFGDVKAGSTASRDITIANHGQAPLQVDDALFTTGSDPRFSVQSGTFPKTVAAGSSVTLKATFAAGAHDHAGTRHGHLRIDSDDPATPSVTRVADARITTPGTNHNGHGDDGNDGNNNPGVPLNPVNGGDSGVAGLPFTGYVLGRVLLVGLIILVAGGLLRYRYRRPG